METIIFIGCNNTGSSMEALMIAKEMDYFIVLFTNRIIPCLPNVDKLIHMKNIFNEEMVLYEVNLLKEQGKQIRACLSFIDPFVSYAAKLSNKLGLMKLSVESLYLMENKIRVRNTLLNHPTSLLYTTIDGNSTLEELLKKYHLSLPFILKSPTSNGSRDVILVNNPESYIKGIRLLQNKHAAPILLEEYITGPQYLIELIIFNKQPCIVAVIEQEVVYNGAFIVVGYNYPAELTKNEYESLTESIEGIVNLLGVTNSSCHLEMKKIQGSWKLIEINPRMSGGHMNQIIEEGTGINLIKEIIKMNIGEQPSLIPSRTEYVYAHYLTVKSNGTLLKVIGKDDAFKHDGVKLIDIKAKEGDLVTVPYSMGNRYGCVIAVGESRQVAKTNALNALSEIKFYLEAL
ncbi:ATP-grasp domain-containing protein [Bacillus sp. FJAT-49732]|uniref:ATP-grasp domain-containing protein n=1 Tax=Lederbergia citrisecunda TaxID=2833583 RepID=A0A942TKJ0_9BACI|nr:ATP-grasp domain-containing protein [Lederbergia citrisecunda]MBS4199886.1 ATP-grasp domain-containing protein [Lederbergia citrisecunda]